ncbi:MULTISPECIES: hypothetical protein [Clostridium]|jgi:hypothetical protein|uniref:Uncharacterized protein n=4 Tax=Clostridium tertium TaxID=1559 RepID=A0A9X3XKR2_9CLOT|nr:MULTISPECIES: hypothetical protein [Clostridium]EEH96725.1 hypothetical protein CSBG_00351 [Clostridium sp. 7_2_43FAA]MBS5306001.1 hypothetical protein [Clostridium sp.]MDB1934478.1 hypothetical protein [Clostridium tertium]MDB1937658.1 hypothetical protein [Clostridium tertium]MDB1944407.1 hypothetical protein [Clostridium tertium]
MHEGVIIFIISCLFIVTLLISLILIIIEIIIKRKVIMNYDDFIRIIDKDIKKLDININLKELLDKYEYEKVKVSSDNINKSKNSNINQIELFERRKQKQMSNYKNTLEITSYENDINNKNNTDKEKGKFIDIIL